GVFLEARLDDVERAVQNAFGGRLLAVHHQRVGELGHQLVAIDRVGDDSALGDFSPAGHLSMAPVRLRDAAHDFGRLTPYFERLALRLALFVLLGPEAPDESSVPRTTW